VKEINLEDNVEEYTFYFSAGLKTYRLSRLREPGEYNKHLALPKFYPVWLDTRRVNTGLGAGIVNLGKKSTYVPPRNALEIGTLTSLLHVADFPPPDILYHSIYNPIPSQTCTGIGKLMGKVVMNYPEGLSIQVYQLSASPTNGMIREEKWTPLGVIPWTDWAPLGNGCPGYDKSILIGNNVSFDTALYGGKLVPNKVELAIVLNAEGNERYSNWKVTPTRPSDIGNRLLPALRCIKTLQDQHWESLLAHTDTILTPTMLITENYVIHKDRRQGLAVKSLSTFLKECAERKKNHVPLSFDPLFSTTDLNGANMDIAILIETNDTTQQTFLQILTECLDTEAGGSLSRTRRQRVSKVYITVSLGQTINAGNIYEMGGDSFMSKAQNPYLADIVFLENETFLSAYSKVQMGSQPSYVQQYLTDPANRGMLVLETFNSNYGEKTEKGFTILQTTRKEKEKILDKQSLLNRTLAYRFIVKQHNQATFEHLVAVHNLTVLQDFTPPFRAGNESLKRYRYGTLKANILSSEQVDKLVAEFNTGGEFFLMKQTDQQGKDPNKTYFSTEMRKFSKQDEGRAALIAMVQAEHKGNTTFWPAPGSMNKFWVVVDKILTQDQVTSLLKKTNKIQASDRKGPLKTFLTYAMKGITTLIEKTVGGSIPLQRETTARRVNTASISISGWPDQVEPEQIGEIFREWGVNLDLSTVSFDWFFATEAEGFTLKVQTTDLVKARELLELRDRKDFEFSVGELTAAQQSHLRLIATTPKGDMETTRTRYPKPKTPDILTETQLSEIKRSVSNPLPGSQPHKEVEKTILGKVVSPTTPTASPASAQVGWKEVGKKKMNKEQNVPPTNGASEEQKGEKENAYAVLEELASEEVGEQDMLDEKHDQEDKEEEKGISSRKKSTKMLEAAKERTAKEASRKKFDALKRQLTKMKLWGTETTTMVDAYVAHFMMLGYDTTNDNLESLLKLSREEIKDNVKAKVTGEDSSEGKKGTPEKSANPPQKPTSNIETNRVQEEETKMEVDGEPTLTLDSNEAITSGEGSEAAHKENQGEATSALHSPGPDPPTSVPPEVQKAHPPDTENTSSLSTKINLSSSEKTRTITGYFQSKAKQTDSSDTPSPSFSQ
jgi:hypothetical protein